MNSNQPPNQQQCEEEDIAQLDFDFSLCHGNCEVYRTCRGRNTNQLRRTWFEGVWYLYSC